jgi:translocation and assembly module TamB
MGVSGSNPKGTAALGRPYQPFALAPIALTGPNAVNDESTSNPAPAQSLPRRGFPYGLAVALALILAIAAGAAFLTTQSALEMVIAQALTRSQGRLSVEGASGSLLSTVQVARIAWQGDDVEVEAEDMALTWSARGLITGKINITGLGAHRLAIAVKESDTPLSLPSDLSLPLEVDIANVGVERLEWRVGARAGIITGVVFDYEGGARTHAVRRLHLVTDAGTLAGTADVGAVAPFALNASLDFAGDGAFRDTRADVAAKGTLQQFGLSAAGTSRDAVVSAIATLTPFAPSPLVTAHVEAKNVDVARFDVALPATHLDVSVDAKPDAAGFAGTLTVGNAEAGAIDAGRVPLAALNSRFRWDGNQLALDDIDARLAGDARVTGSAAFPKDGSASRWRLGVRDLDLHRLQSTLAATRLTGALNAEVAEARQTINGELAQAGMSLAFAATVTGPRIDVERFRGRAGDGEITGRGRITLDRERTFEVSASAAHFDPSRFGAFAAGALDGTLAVRGQLAPAWSADAEIALASGSRLEGLPVSGNLRGNFSPQKARNVAIKANVASASFSIAGAVGTPGDKLTFTADSARIEELRGVLAKHAGFAIPATIAGALHIRGALQNETGGNGLDLDVRGERVQWGNLLAAGTVQATAAIAPGGVTLDPVANATRALRVSLVATRVSVPQGDFAALSAEAAGTMANHTARFAVAADGVDAHASVAGGLHGLGTSSLSWSGSLETLDNRGTTALQLEGSVPIEWARDHLHVGAARLRVAEGRANLDDLRWDAGKLSSRGAFNAVPLTALTALSGVKSPLASSLVLAGDWSIAASPQLNGVVRIRRENGDLYGSESATNATAKLALGITTLEFEARFADDKVSGRGTLRSLRAGNADATFSIQPAPGSEPGRVPLDGPLVASLVADLPSMRPLQPWLGTLAVVDGRAHVELSASGSVSKLVLAGMFTADAVRLDVPQYGVHWQDGLLRARVANNAFVLEELSFTGGEGTFTANGTLARAAPDANAAAGPAARVMWTAKKFRAVNRPDFHLTASGNGVLSIENGKLAVRGSMEIDQARIDYEPTSVGALGNDVIVVGRQRAAAAAASLDVPLLLDLDVGLGDDTRFAGEGLDTGLSGKLHIGTATNGVLTARGTIRAVNGTYYVFGQRLEIDRGQLIFDGPADNPAMDVVALRKNVGVEAGVEVTGTVRLPRVRLVSNPPVPDGEKLSWLMTGQGLDRASKSDLAALGVASASLVGKGQRPLSTTIANSIGLDDISLRERSNSVTNGTSSQVVAFGKRINDRLALVYEQGLTVASNALRIEYALTRTLTLRAEAGVVTSLGLYFRRSYD